MKLTIIFLLVGITAGVAAYEWHREQAKKEQAKEAQDLNSAIQQFHQTGTEQDKPSYLH